MEELYLEDIAEVRTGKYDANHGNSDGPYIFYTCAFGQYLAPTYSFEGEAIVLPGNGANVGEVFFNRDGKFEAYQRTYVVYNIKAHVPFIYFYFKAFWKKSLINSQFGSATNYIRLGNLTKFKISVPSLNDQKRIAQVLSDCEELIAKRKESIALLDELVKSTFLEMFGDPVRNEMGWDIKKLKTVYSDKKEGTKCGPFGSALKKNEYVSEGVAVWNMDNITKKFKLKLPPRLFITKSKSEDLSKYQTKPNDIIISRAGTVGKMAIVGETYPNAIISTNLIRLRLDTSKVLPLYFTSLMAFCGHRLGRLKTGADGTFTHMSTKILDDLEIPIPKIEMQQDYIIKANKINEVQFIYKTHLQELENLYARLSQDAFKGALDLSKVVLREENMALSETTIEDIFEIINYEKHLAAITRLEEVNNTITHGKTFMHKTTSNVQQVMNPQALRGVIYEEMPWGMFSKQIAQSLDKNPFLRTVGSGLKKHFEVKANKVKELDSWMQLPENCDYIKSLKEMIAVYQDPFISNDLFQIELLNTVLRCIKVLDSTSSEKVYAKMKTWKMKEDGFKNKAEKFSEKQTEKMVEFIVGLGWVK